MLRDSVEKCVFTGHRHDPGPLAELEPRHWLVFYFNFDYFFNIFEMEIQCKNNRSQQHSLPTEKGEQNLHIYSLTLHESNSKAPGREERPLLSPLCCLKRAREIAVHSCRVWREIGIHCSPFSGEINWGQNAVRSVCEYLNILLNSPSFPHRKSNDVKPINSCIRCRADQQNPDRERLHVPAGLRHRRRRQERIRRRQSTFFILHFVRKALE